jgi:hypothetical protein
MVKKTLFIGLLLISSFIFMGMGSKPAPEKHATAVVEVKQGISGKVEIWEGNFMPMVDPKSTNHKVTPGAGRRVRIHQPVKMEGGLALAKRDSVNSPLVAETLSDSVGKFLVSVQPGTYSVFVEEAGSWYANSWNGDGVQGAVVVESGKITDMLIKITSKATF